MGNITGNHDIPRFISYASKGLSFSEDAKEAGWDRDVKIKDTIGYNKLKMLTKRLLLQYQEFRLFIMQMKLGW